MNARLVVVVLISWGAGEALAGKLGQMATIENRGELQWRAVVRKKGFARYTRTFERHRDAQGWATDLEAAIGRRDLAEIRRLTNDGGGDLRTVGDVVNKFLTDVVAKPGRRANQVASEKPRLARIREDLGKLTLEMLSPQDIAAWRESDSRPVPRHRPCGTTSTRCRLC